MPMSILILEAALNRPMSLVDRVTAAQLAKTRYERRFIAKP
jgi:hypothetical protein